MALSAAAASLLGAGLSTVGNTVGNFISNTGSRKSQKRAARYNREFWDAQNFYNKPENQMKRLQNAGLNPHLVYGQSASGAAGQAGAISPYQAEDYKFDNPLKDIQDYSNLEFRQAQSNNVEAQRDVILQDAILKSLQAGTEIEKKAKTHWEAKQAEEIANYSADAQKAIAQKLEQEAIGAQLDNAFKDRSLNARVKKVFYEAQMLPKQIKGQDLKNELMRLEKELNQIGIQRGDAWYFRILGRFLNSDGNFKF